MTHGRSRGWSSSEAVFLTVMAVASTASVPSSGTDGSWATCRVAGPEDVTLKILYCGVCATDLHQIKNDYETWMTFAKQQSLKFDWATVKYPMVPGHEIVGSVTGVGEQVSGFVVGDTVGVGCLLGSCRECDSCEKGVEQYCPATVLTYNDLYPDGSRTQGGFSSVMICDHKYVGVVTYLACVCTEVSAFLCVTPRSCSS